MLNKKALAASLSVTAEKVYVEDVFSTWLYTGNGSSNPGQTITNGIDLSNKGGLVWLKNRGSVYGHRLFDSARSSNYLDSSSTVESSAGLDFLRTTSGFTLKANDFEINATDEIYTSWTFRKQSKFFDVVTYTGNGSARTISHNLGSVPGCIIVKRTDTTGDWYVYHRSNTAAPETDYLLLNSTAATADLDTVWNDTAPTSTVFSVGTNTGVNANSGTYVAYLFAHDAGGFGNAGDQSVISCGSFTSDSNGQATIDLGWEPQWFLFKRTNNSNSASWFIVDNMRAMPVGSSAFTLAAQTTGAEANFGWAQATATGIAFTNPVGNLEVSSPYIYIAIRRGPMKTPTDATKVFTPTVYTGTNVDNRLINTTIAPDMVMIRQRNDTVVPGMYTGARLTGQEFLITGSTNAGATDLDSFDAQILSGTERGNAFSSMSGVWVGNDATRKFNANTTTDNHIIEAFKRAPGFMDVVCYTGTGANRTVTHNLGVAPEMMWVKARNTTGAWTIYHSANGNTKYARFNDSGVPATDSTMWNNTSPTSSTFALGTNSDVNQSTSTYIAVLFASCSGVSKIGSYTGNGTSQTINCGFTNGTRFVLIKRTDDTGDWPIFDSARGIVAAEDPYFLLNANTAEIAGLRDAVDSTSSGFIVNETTGPNINTNNATYIYIAIA